MSNKATTAIVISIVIVFTILLSAISVYVMRLSDEHETAAQTEETFTETKVSVNETSFVETEVAATETEMQTVEETTAQPAIRETTQAATAASESYGPKTSTSVETTSLLETTTMIETTTVAETTTITETTIEPTIAETPITEPQYTTYYYPTDTLTELEENLLVRVASCEAGNQGWVGMALVMRVILNRSIAYNADIETIVYSPRQFSVIGCKAWNDNYIAPEALNALQAVKSGWDESKGALFFCSPKSNKWHASHLRYLFTGWGHEFYTY